jgi:acetyl-CoA C-acetyltransferase/acetyl-CoA acyltransferase
MSPQMIEPAVIVAAGRSPMGKGKPGGALSDIHAVDLLSQVLAGLVEQTGVDPGAVDDVLIGCVSQVGEQSGTPGRQAWLAAGFPEHVPSTTIERKCGSGQQALDFAVHGVMAGAYDIAIAGGIESMSRMPMGSNRMGMDPQGPSVRNRYPNLTSQGVAAELVAHKWNISREALDEYSARSHERAGATADSGGFDREIIAISTPSGMVSADESIRRGSTAEKLATLTPAFATEENRELWPDLHWRVTAGNSSQITDGAAALLVMSEKSAAQYGLRPRARIVATTVLGDDPVLMLTGPIAATHRVLAKAGLKIDDMDAIEVNEAFASVPLAWLAEFPVDIAKLNPVGGAVALGHPLGASGARITTTLLHHLEATGGRYGLQTMCEAGGMANAMIIERLD